MVQVKLLVELMAVAKFDCSGESVAERLPIPFIRIFHFYGEFEATEIMVLVNPIVGLMVLVSLKVELIALVPLVDGYVRAIKVHTSYLKSLSKGYKFIS